MIIKKTIEFFLISCTVCFFPIKAMSDAAIIEKAGEYYNTVEGADSKAPQRQYLLGENTAFGQLVEAVDKGKIRPNDLWVFFDFDSTLVIKKEETPQKKAFDGHPRGSETQKSIPKNFHEITNTFFMLQALNERNIPWGIITARPDENHKGINRLKEELVKAGVERDKLTSFLSPVFKNYKVNINDKLVHKFNFFSSYPKSRDVLWKEGEISEFKLSNAKHPAQDGNIILMAHMPKSWAIYYLLEDLEHKKQLPKFIVFMDDSKTNIEKMKASLSDSPLVLSESYPIINLASLKKFAKHIQFILIHYARDPNQLLPDSFFTDDSDNKALKIDSHLEK